MTQMRDRSRLAPLLGGVALAMLVLATMIGSVQAETVCERCVTNAWNRASTDQSICPDSLGQAKHGCITDYVKQHCHDTGICPDATQAPSTVSCAGYLEEGVECPNNALGICSNQVWEINCEANTSKKCKDTQVSGGGLISACHVTCSCRE